MHMKKIIVIVVLIVLIGLGVYMFFYKDQTHNVCEPGFRFVPSTQSCEPIGGPIDTEVITLDFSKITVQIPDSKIQLQLKQDGQTTKYSNTYQDPELPMVKGFVTLDSKDLVEYSSDFVLIPFVINPGGTGQFLYVGLFDVRANTHLSSVYIGDRVDINTMQMAGEKIKVNFKTRLDSESFAVEPLIPAQVVMEVKDRKLSEILRLQNADYSDIEIKSPLPLVSKGTLVLKAAVPGTWYFEANAGFRILDNAYNEIAIGNIMALSDWMTSQRVPFELNATNISYKGKGTLIIMSDNPEGGEEGERKVKKMYLPVTFQ